MRHWSERPRIQVTEMRRIRPLFAAGALLACACAAKLYVQPDEARVSEAEALQLTEISLAEELKDPAMQWRDDTPVLYVRIGEKPAPKDLLARLKPPAPFQLRPDPTDRPKGGTCVQVRFPRGSHDDKEIVEVSVEYGHSHPGSIQMDTQGTAYAYRRQDAGWVLVRRGRFIT